MGRIPEEEERVHARARKGGRSRAEFQRGDRGTGADYCIGEIVAHNIKGTEYSVPAASAMGLEHQHPTMITLWRHGDRSRIRRRTNMGSLPYS